MIEDNGEDDNDTTVVNPVDNTGEVIFDPSLPRVKTKNAKRLKKGTLSILAPLVAATALVAYNGMPSRRDENEDSGKTKNDGTNDFVSGSSKTLETGKKMSYTQLRSLFS